ncbi:MAG: dehydrogenase E1 component subunit alpha/beta [Planctomycetota bacterium]|nr:dehydrogenase E1 component subunit alpha/beta [Planctomycetota bacterium]
MTTCKKDISGDSKTFVEFYRTMVKIRTFESKVKELIQLNEVGGAAHLSTGQEAVAVGCCSATGRHDQILSTHRGHGHMIAKGADIGKMFAEILGRAAGYCHGKGGSMHIADPELGFAGANGIVGGGITIASGIALAGRLLKTGGICVCFFGDGAAAQGGLHEALNLCALWKLPVLYVCENNQYAMSSPVCSTMATDAIANLARPYNIAGQQVDGNNVLDVFEAADRAMRHIRSNNAPYLLECLTYRQEGHYCGDPCLYRDRQRTLDWIEHRDPIQLLRAYLTSGNIASDSELDEHDVAIRQEIDQAACNALTEQEPSLNTLEEQVYTDLWACRDIKPPVLDEIATVEVTYRDATNRALDEEMARDENVVLLGEDVGIHGGAFQVTKGLYKKYGGERVRTTPISEAVIGGCTLGAALAGLRPVGEFQYSDFMTLAMDQIANQAAKVHYMFGGRLHAPLVYRAPCGSGGRGNASQHSQSLEAWFMHVPGLKVVMPATPFDMIGLLKTAIRDEDPVIFLEHKALYNTKGLVPVEEYLLPFGRADVKRAGTDITIVATSRMVLYSLEAAGQLAAEGISAEVIDLRTLVPLDKEKICSSVAKTGFALVVSEDCRRGGVASEISTIINETVFDELDHAVVRLTGRDVPIPYNRTLERAAVPSVQDVCNMVRRTLGTGS